MVSGWLRLKLQQFASPLFAGFSVMGNAFDGDAAGMVMAAKMVLDIKEKSAMVANGKGRPLWMLLSCVYQVSFTEHCLEN